MFQVIEFGIDNGPDIISRARGRSQPTRSVARSQRMSLVQQSNLSHDSSQQGMKWICLYLFLIIIQPRPIMHVTALTDYPSRSLLPAAAALSVRPHHRAFDFGSLEGETSALGPCVGTQNR